MKTNTQQSTAALDRLFANLENGNITEAKAQAKRHTSFRLSMFARQILGWSFDRATLAAGFLKGEATFQEYCDAK